MVGNNENILVEFDYQNIVLVDPNKVVDNQGEVRERLLKHENLVYYANLECNLFPRTRLSVGSNGYYENKTISVAAINFMNPGNKTFLDNDYLDEITGFNSTIGKGTNQIVETKNQITKPDKTTESYLTQGTSNKSNNNLLLINEINIQTPLNLLPTVTIKMEDIRGRALFEQGENSPYSVFFNYPYPLFYLTVKGYLGKAVKYQLALKTFSARFDTMSGNFKIEVVFLAYKFNVLTMLNMQHVLAVPYMYKTRYTSTPANDPGAQSAQNQVGNTTKEVTTISTARGYQKVKEVYSEYKSKGLIPDDFPEITLHELLTRLEKLEETITNLFGKADMTPITDGENYRNNLIEFEQKVYFYNTDSWFNKYLDTKNFFIDSSTGLRMYTFNSQTIANKQKRIAEVELSEKLIPEYSKRLANNPTFGSPGKYKIANKEYDSKIENTISYKMFTMNVSAENIDWNATYLERTGKQPTQVEVDKLRSDYQSVFNSITLDENYEAEYKWFVFDGKGRFLDTTQTMQNKLSSKLDEIQNELAKLLSDRLADPKSGLGFKPTLKNVIAVLLASSEAFLRMMCNVHENAWNQRTNKYRRAAILDNDKAATSVDAKQAVQTSDGNLIPVYPWPQYFVETNDPKGEKFEITYPGDPKVVAKTKAYSYDIWPEVEFVEEYLKGRTVTISPTNETKSDIYQSSFINRVSFNSIDFPTTNALFGNKQEIKFMYEIWERVFLPANYQRFAKPGAENEILDTLAEAEFINISKSLLNDAPFLIQKLKQYGFNSTNYVEFLASISNDGVGESWQKYIRDIFVTGYIQHEVENNFAILDSATVLSGANNIDSQPKNTDKLKQYLGSNLTNDPSFLDIFPYSLDSWHKINLANGSTALSVRDTYNTTKVYELNEENKMVANFSKSTTQTEKRPITSFSFIKPTTPKPNQATLRSFYQSRTPYSSINEHQITEGVLTYINYSGNVSFEQTTSMLNTPMFVNSVLDGVDKWMGGSSTPFVSSAYILLNSLPIATLREKYKTYNTTTSDLDYMFATFKKFGGIHKVPYAWVLKYGSIWHRYKKYIEDGTDILSGVWTNFNYAKAYDPVASNPLRTYTLTIPGSSTTTELVLQKTTTVSSGSVSQMNIGFYPEVINKFNLLYRGYNLFSGYTDLDIQGQLDNTVSGFTLTQVSEASINTGAGYDPNNQNDILYFRPWNITLLDKDKKIEYIVPSFGTVVNQAVAECFDDNQKLKIPILSNNAVYNGSARLFWSLPNYGYFDATQIDMPSPKQHLRTILSGQSDQLAFCLGKATNYSTNEEMLSVFNKEILDQFENEFLSFTKSMYEYETQQISGNTIIRVQTDKMFLDADGVNRNFQLLMKAMMTVDIATPGAPNSGIQTEQLQQNQFKAINNVLKSFLEFDVILKVGNPGDYNRKLFDSYSSTAFVEDRISFNPYVPGSLPTSGVTGISLATYKAANPQTWKTLETYVGYSTEPQLEYTSTGSYITDFFVDMNIEFIPESVETLAPLIKIYATQKKKDPTLNRAKFVGLIDGFIAENKKFSDLLLNSLFQKIRYGLPTIDIIPEKPLDTALQGEQTKVELWEFFKGLNDTWIAGYDYTQTTMLEDVLLLDRANRNISNDVLIDPFKIRHLLKNINPSASVYYYLESILDIHHFICMMHPAYINYYNVQEVQKNSTPKIEGTLEFGNNLFGTYLNVDTRGATPKLVCVYAAEPSKHLTTDKNFENRFKSDAFDLRRSSDNPLTDKLEDKQDWGLSNRVVGFNVDIGTRNQNIFYYFDVAQDLGKQTAESLTQIDTLINQSNGRQMATQNVSLWNFYKNRSYQCRVNMLGNVMIQPTMYFNLRYVPMFNGPYYIMEVNHNISPGKFETTFTGIRQQVFALPKLDSYIQTLTKKLFVELYEQIKQKPTTNVKDNANANSNPNSITTTTTKAQMSTVVSSTGTIDNSQNCSSRLVFADFIPGTKQQVSASPKQIFDAINTNVITDYDNQVTRLLSFITIYLESYSNNQFTAFNNNFAGVRLNYIWPGQLPEKFTKNYLCVLATDGYSYPYAEFNDINKLCELLWAKWGPVSPLYTITPTSLTEAWIRRWNRNEMTKDDFDKFKTNNEIEYSNIVYRVNEAIKLWNSLSGIS